MTKPSNQIEDVASRIVHFQPKCSFCGKALPAGVRELPSTKEAALVWAAEKGWLLTRGCDESGTPSWFLACGISKCRMLFLLAISNAEELGEAFRRAEDETEAAEAERGHDA